MRLDVRAIALLGEERNHGRHVAADAVARDRNAAGIHIELVGMLGHMLEYGIAFLNRDGKRFSGERS